MQAVLILACLAVANALPHFPSNDLEGSFLALSKLEDYVPYLSNVEADVGRYKRSAEPGYLSYGQKSRGFGQSYNHRGFGHSQNNRGFGGGYNRGHQNRGFGGGYQSYGRRNRGYVGYHGHH